MRKSLNGGLLSILISCSIGFASTDNKVSEGINYYKMGNYEKALSSFEEVLKTEPQNSVALSNLGFIYYKMGNLSKAKEYLTKSLYYIKDKELISISYYVLGDIEKKSRNEDGYQKNLKLSLRYNPEFEDAINELLNYYYSKKNFEEIVSLNLNPKKLSENQQIILAESFIKTNKNKQEGISILERLKSSKDTKISVKAAELLSLIREKEDIQQKEQTPKLAKTTQSPRRIEAVQPEHQNIYHIFKTKPVKDISDIEKPISRTEVKSETEQELISSVISIPSPENFNKIGLLQLKQGKMEEAKISFMNALKIDPFNTDALNNLGILYFNLKDYDKAIKYFSEALKRDKSFTEAYYNLGNVYYRLGEVSKADSHIKQAIENYKKVVSLNPYHKHAIYNTANSYFMLEDYRTAINFYKKIENLDGKMKKNLSLSYYNLALQEENKDEAIRYLKEAVMYDPLLKEANFLLGRLLYEKGSYRDAKDYLVKAYQQYPEKEKAEVIYFLGLAYNFSDDKDRAISYYKELRNLNPELADRLFESIFQ
ncbi:MAG: tetratricopeptide repeat protein [Hydrogenothermaceae bacterium]|nr:tetratricopeptide repeat protein [Hydrogenothermaceae bacterium]